MMKQYRIGRVQLPWANLDPPIRSPDYYKNLELQKKAKAKANGSDRRSKKSIDLGSVGYTHNCHWRRPMHSRIKLTL
jgi:delta8-fatty-acid desaturase